MVRCVCASIKPGSSVASPRSITSAPAGTLAPPPTPTILPSTTTTRPGAASASLFPSNIRAALSTYVLPPGFCWLNVALAARQHVRSIRNFRMVHVPRLAAENPPPKNILSPPNVKPPAIVERFAFLSVLVMLKVNAARVPPWSGVFLEIRPRASHSSCESPTPARCGQLRPVLDDCQPAIALQLCPRSGPGTLPRTAETLTHS